MERRPERATMSAAARDGDTVARAAGPWTPAVHRLLRHLRAHGLDWVPAPLGLGTDGRERLTFLPGTVPRYPLPAWTWRDDVLADAGARLRDVHRATAGFDAAGGPWRLRSHEPAEVVCHNDFAPYNLVFDDRRAIAGVIDWDTASPGPRVWDLAYLAYRLGRPDNPDTAGAPGPSDRPRRLGLLCRAYGGDLTPAVVAAAVVPRLRELAALTAARGEAVFAEHARRYRDDAAWLAAHAGRTARLREDP